MSMTPSILYRTAEAATRLTFRPDEFLYGPRWGARGGTSLPAYALHADLANAVKGQHLTGNAYFEHTAEWYGFDTREAALAAARPERTAELRHYRVQIENPIRPFDETPLLDVDVAARLADHCIATGLDAHGDDSVQLRELTHALGSLRRAFGVRLKRGGRVSHAELWILAAAAAGLADAAPMPVQTIEEALIPTEEDRMGAVLLALGFDAVHLSDKHRQWWLIGEPPVAKPELFTATLMPHHPPTKE